MAQKDNLKIENSDGVSIESLYNNEWALKNRKINCKCASSFGYFDFPIKDANIKFSTY